MESLSMTILGIVILLGAGGVIVLLIAKLFFDSTDLKHKSKPDESHLQEKDIFTLSGDENGEKDHVRTDPIQKEEDKKAA